MATNHGTKLEQAHSRVACLETRKIYAKYAHKYAKKEEEKQEKYAKNMPKLQNLK